jgi:hypothetical protein
MAEQAIAKTILRGTSWLREEGVDLNGEMALVANTHCYSRCRFLYSFMSTIHLYIGV